MGLQAAVEEGMAWIVEILNDRCYLLKASSPIDAYDGRENRACDGLGRVHVSAAHCIPMQPAKILSTGHLFVRVISDMSKHFKHCRDANCALCMTIYMCCSQ